MKFYLDSAKLTEIEYAYSTFGIDGVTTNPKHIKESGKPFLEDISEIADWVKKNGLTGKTVFPVSVEVNPHLGQAEEIIAAAEKIAPISENFVIKVPCSEQGVKAARFLKTEGIETNLTLVFSSAQAIWAGRNGLFFVSPFLGWQEDNGEDPKSYLQQIVTIYKNYGWYGKTQIICAAVRTPKQIADCAAAGADIVTAGLGVYQNSFNHAYTVDGIGRFTAAWDATVTE